MSDKQTPKVGFVSLGCPKNLVDSEVMLGTLSRQGYAITANKEDADFIFGPDELGRILEAVRLDESSPIPDVSIDALYTSTEVPTIPRILTTPSYTAYLKVSEGCDHVCSFCAIPGFRGKFRSRSLAGLVS